MNGAGSRQQTAMPLYTSCVIHPHNTEDARIKKRAYISTYLPGHDRRTTRRHVCTVHVHYKLLNHEDLMYCVYKYALQLLTNGPTPRLTYRMQAVKE